MAFLLSLTYQIDTEDAKTALEIKANIQEAIGQLDGNPIGIALDDDYMERDD